MPAENETTTMSRRSERAGKRWLFGSCFALLVAAGVFAGALIVWGIRAPRPAPPRRAIPVPNGFDACSDVYAGVPTTPATLLIRGKAPAVAAVRADLRPYRNALESLHAALLLPYETPPHRIEGVGAFAELPGARNMGRVLAAEVWLRNSDGDHAQAMAAALDGLDLAASIPRGGGGLHELVGIALLHIAAPGFRATAPHLTAAEAARAGERLDGILRDLPALSEIITAERYISLTEASRMTGGATWLRGWVYRDLERQYQHWLAEAPQPASRRSPGARSWMPVAQMVAQTMPGVWQKWDEATAQFRLLRLHLALHEFRRAHGRYPADLSALRLTVPGVTSSPLTGAPFTYQPSEQGNSYLLERQTEWVR